MDRMVTVKEMRQRYSCSSPTARKYLRKCVPHLEAPLVAPEWAVLEWEKSRTIIPAETSRKKMEEIRRRQGSGCKTIVPRKRA